MEDSRRQSGLTDTRGSSRALGVRKPDIVRGGLPIAVPVEFCYRGWQASLLLLAHLVEADIPDGV
jgi:hypothetical protein